MRILTVDDDPVCRRVLQEILAAEPDLQVTEAGDGSAAWALLDNPSRRFDLLFLDITMPTPDGLELLARIRDSQILRSLRVVVCTATSDRGTVSKAIKLGARRFIVKPATAPLVQAQLNQMRAELAVDGTRRGKSADVPAG